MNETICQTLVDGYVHDPANVPAMQAFADCVMLLHAVDPMQTHGITAFQAAVVLVGAMVSGALVFAHETWP